MAAAAEADLVLRGEKPVHGGAVLARDEGRVVFLLGALPGEEVRAQPMGRRGGAAFASTVEVRAPAPERVAPRCRHYGVCGGCQWQHADYGAQLRFKQGVVAEVWQRAGLRLPPGTPILGMDDPWRYRVRGEFEAFARRSPDTGERRLELGFHRMRSHQIVPIEECPIHVERIERGLLAFRDAARRLQVEGLVNLHLTAEPEGSGLLWRVRYKRRDQNAQTAALVAAVQKALPDIVLLDVAMDYDVLGLHFRVRSDTFIQTNHRQTPVLYGTALEMLAAGPDDQVLDLYCGMGTLSLAAAREAGSVLGVEENPEAIRLAQLATRINDASGARFRAGRVEDVLGEVRIGACDAALLDPPRAGLEPAAVGQLLRLAPSRIVYISCEPSTHARDLALLVGGGYRIRRAALVDMFPQTYHVESVALLERG